MSLTSRQHVCLCEKYEKIQYDLSAAGDNDDDEDGDDYEKVEMEEETSHLTVWERIVANDEEERNELENYIRSKDQSCNVPENPPVAYLGNEVFPLLISVLEGVIHKAKEMDCLKHQKSTFNGVDFAAEMLWNLNPRHPERRNSWTCVHNMDWAVEHLKNHPRRYFPFSWVWRKDFAATKIQAAMRGYWARRRENVQEVRQFWKTLRREKLEGQKKSSVERVA